MGTTNGRQGRSTKRLHANHHDPDAHAHEAIRVHLKVATCYNLLMREARVRIFQRWGLTLPQFDVLAELARASDDGFTFVELSRLLLVTSGNLTGIVDRLEARQLVRRQADPHDRRIIRVRLTEKGRKLTEEILPRHRKDLHELLSFMPLDRLVRLTALLDALKQGLAFPSDELQSPPRRDQLESPASPALESRSRATGRDLART
jgi:DNA-binding MarR family transcriptional regulator